MQLARIACLSIGLSVLWHAVPCAAQQQSAALAQERYSRGLTLLQANDDRGALVEFQASLALFASPNTRLMVGRALVHTGELAQAAEAFELALHEAEDRSATDPRYRETIRSAREELDEIEPRLARVTVRVNGASGALVLSVCGRTVPAEAIGLPIAAMPGRCEIRAGGLHTRSDAQSLNLSAGDRREVTLTVLADVPRPVIVRVVPHATPTPAFQWTAPRIGAGIAIGVGVGTLLIAGVLAGMADTQYQSLRVRCMDGPCPFDASGEIANGRALQTSAEAMLGIGLVGLAAGAALIVFDTRVHRREVRVGWSGQSITVGGSF